MQCSSRPRNETRFVDSNRVQQSQRKKVVESTAHGARQESRRLRLASIDRGS